MKEINEKGGLIMKKVDTLSQQQMEKVLKGENIDVSLPGEFGSHYLEENWKRLTNKEQMLIRKWIRFMFFYSKNINYNRTSYGLKHSCESDVGFYVHNDSMKKAFLLEGFTAKTGKINWFFNATGELTIKKSNKFKEIFKEEIENIKQKI